MYIDTYVHDCTSQLVYALILVLMCVSACVLLHPFMLKLCCCSWSVDVTCVCIVLCVLFLAFWLMCDHSCWCMMGHA